MAIKPVKLKKNSFAVKQAIKDPTKISFEQIQVGDQVFKKSDGFKGLADLDNPPAVTSETTVIEKPYTGSALIPGSTPPPGKVLTPEELDAAENQQAKSLVEYDLLGGPQETATELGLGDDLFDTSLEAYVDRFKKKQAEEVDYMEKQQALQNQIQQTELKQVTRGSESQLAATKASLAPGREGFEAGTARGAISEFSQNLQSRLGVLESRVQFSVNERHQAMKELQDAQKEGKKELASQLRAKIENTKREQRAAETELLKAQSLMAETALSVTDTVTSTMEAMGSAVANLSYEQLSKMTEGTNLTMPAALALQKAISLEAEAEEAKTEAESVKLKLEADKLRKDIEQIGVMKPTAAMQEFEFMQGLAPSDQQAFMEMKRAKPNLQFYSMDDGRIVSVDPQTGDANIVFSQPGQDTGIPVGDFNNTADLPEEKVKTTSAFGEGVVTGYGSYAWSEGLDFRLGERGSKGPVAVPFDFEVVDFGSNGNWGNQVKVKNLQDGRELWISHLSAIGELEKNKTYSSGTIIGKQGSTGESTGEHLDLTMPKEDGGYYTPKQVASYLGVGKTPMGPVRREAEALLMDFGGTGEQRDQAVKNIVNMVESGEAESVADAKIKLNLISKSDKDLQKSMEAEVKGTRDSFNELNNKLVSVIPLAASGSPIGDVGIVVNFLKVLDPRSVARESEVASVEEARSLISNVEALYNKALTGEKLTQSQRNQIIQASKILQSSSADYYLKQLYRRQNELNEKGIPATFTSQSQIEELEAVVGEDRAEEIKAEIGLSEAPTDEGDYSPYIEEFIFSKFGI